jgi:lysophospholipase L1-like esterase
MARTARGIFASNSSRVLFQQKGIVHKTCKKLGEQAQDHIVKLEINQKKAAPLHISGRVQTRGVTGSTGDNLLIVTNIEYAKTPIFWDTILYPDTGTHPWQYLEKYVHARLPIKSITIYFRLTLTIGEAWFRDFRVEEIPPWDESADCVVALLGDSTDMGSYLEYPYRTNRLLELLLRDRFPGKVIGVRNLAESGDYLKQLLEKGRLERDLATLPQCDLMIIRYGLNDLGQKIPPSEFKKQLKQTCDIVRKRFPKAWIILSTTIPTYSKAMNDKIRELAAERKYPLIDIEALLTREAGKGNGNWHKGKMSNIGYPTEKNPDNDPTGLKGNIHPNNYGSRLMAEQYFRDIAPIVAQRLKK